MDPSPITIRPARPDDALDAARLFQIAGTGLLETLFDAPTEPTIRALARMFPAPGHVFSYTYSFIAERDGATLGMYSGLDKEKWGDVLGATKRFNLRWLAVMPPWRFPRFLRALRDLYGGPDEPASDDPTGDSFYIEWLAVMPHARRQGVATSLLDHAAGQARARGLDYLALEVLIENEDARRFYDRYGFEQVHVTRNAWRFNRRYGSQGYILLVKPV